MTFLIIIGMGRQKPCKNSRTLNSSTRSKAMPRSKSRAAVREHPDEPTILHHILSPGVEAQLRYGSSPPRHHLSTSIRGMDGRGWGVRGWVANDLYIAGLVSRVCL